MGGYVTYVNGSLPSSAALPLLTMALCMGCHKGSIRTVDYAKNPVLKCQAQTSINRLALEASGQARECQCAHRLCLCA